MDHRPSIMYSVALIATASTVALAGSAVFAQETQPVGKTKGDQQRNAELLSDYDCSSIRPTYRRHVTRPPTNRF